VNTASGREASADCVLLAHGGGGELMNRIIRDHLLGPLANPLLAPLTDGAILPPLDGQPVMTTDSYVVTPLEFPGGDIGAMAVAGTVNDLAVMGATPIALSLGLIIEEGLPLDVLDRVVASIARTAREAGVQIATGDTKVIERGHRDSVQGQTASDGLFINTAGVGCLRSDVRLGVERVAAGDVVLVNGPIAEHGLSIMALRGGIAFETELRSDAAPLNGMLGQLFDAGLDVKFCRDATRGGVAGVLADISEARGLTIEIEEQAVPLHPTARHAAEMLGLDPLSTANEGKIICVVAEGDGDRAVRALQNHPLGQETAVIGRVVESHPPLVELITRAGGRRVVQRPYGEELPRIC
jgi:hydrogenase expression/formation protein HypE